MSVLSMSTEGNGAWLPVHSWASQMALTPGPVVSNIVTQCFSSSSNAKTSVQGASGNNAPATCAVHRLSQLHALEIERPVN